MSLKPILFMTSGLLLAGGSVWYANGVMEARPAPAVEAVAAPAQTFLIAANVDIPFGSEIRRADLVAQTWPTDMVPEGAFDDANVLFGPPGSPPRRATQTIRAGDVLKADAVSNFGENVSIGSTLSDGARAVAISVNAETAVGGFVTPGDHVDIVLTEGRGETLRTGVILQNIRVLATDQNANTGGGAARTARTITVEVSAREGQVLTLAQQAGLLSLALRQGSAAGTTAEDLDQITMDDVWGTAAPLPVAPGAAPVVPRTVCVRRGLETSTVALQ